MSSGPNLTVLIPTRDRCQTLGSTIASCLAQEYPHLRVIVSDNCSTDGTAQVVAGFNDPRLHYVRTPQRFSMTGNFEFSLRLAQEGEYVMHLGDDDGLILHGLTDVARIISRTGAEAVNSIHSVYHWPSSLYAGYANRLILPKGEGYAWVSGLDAALEVVSFRKGYSFLPSTYSGFVAKAVIDRVAGDRAYYSSITPDSFSGFVNAGSVTRFVLARRPFAIAGLSGRSNGGSNLNTAGGLGEAGLYLAENDLPTHPDIVYCPKSIAIVVAEAFLQARERVPRLREVKFDMTRLCHVALSDASAENYPAVREAVAAIAVRHGLTLDIPTQPTVRQRLGREADKMRVRVHRLRQGYRRFDTAAHGVLDVAGAARFAYQMLGPLPV